MLEYVSQKSQIKHIQIITNGTIIPNEDILKTMRSIARCHLLISNYKSNSYLQNILKIDKIIDLCKQYKICHHLLEFNLWYKSQKINKQYIRNKDKAKHNFIQCGLGKHHNISYGKFYCCAPALYIDKHYQNFQFEYDECFDIINIEPSQLTLLLIKLYSKQYFELCSFCDTSQIEICTPIAEQLYDKRHHPLP
jgi:hypothetical protein